MTHQTKTLAHWVGILTRSMARTNYAAMADGFAIFAADRLNEPDPVGDVARVMAAEFRAEWLEYKRLNAKYAPALAPVCAAPTTYLWLVGEA